MKQEVEDKGNSITMYIYKVRRQTKFLDSNAVLKRATTYCSYEPLNIGGLYMLKIIKKGGFYRVESLIETLSV